MWWGGPFKKAALLVGLGLVLAGVGCGEGEGVAGDAAVTVYAANAACPGAQRAAEGRAGEIAPLKVRVLCLPAVEDRGRLDLAQIGANARRASEDSTAIAYIGEAEPRANLYSKPILEEAGIAQLPGVSGAVAIGRIFDSIRAQGGSGNLRESVDGDLAGA